MPIWHQTSSTWSCICDLIYDPEPKATQTADSESHSNWAESFCVFRQSIAWDSKVLTFFQERATVCCKRVFLWLEHIHAGSESECCLLLLALLYATDESHPSNSNLVDCHVFTSAETLRSPPAKMMTSPLKQSHSAPLWTNWKHTGAALFAP